MDGTRGNDTTPAGSDANPEPEDHPNEDTPEENRTLPRLPYMPPPSYARIAAGWSNSHQDNEGPSDEEDLLDDFPGPIKGFDDKKIYLNLNGQVQQDWAKKDTAILVHYLDGAVVLIEILNFLWTLSTKCTFFAQDFHQAHRGDLFKPSPLGTLNTR